MQDIFSSAEVANLGRELLGIGKFDRFRAKPKEKNERNTTATIGMNRKWKKCNKSETTKIQ